jgi:hypothetical protein
VKISSSGHSFACSLEFADQASFTFSVPYPPYSIMGLKRDREDSAPDTLSQEATDTNIEPSVLRETKFTQLDDSASNNSKSSTNSKRSVTCLLPPHQPQRFPNIQAYENHVASAHVNRCKECGKNLPSSHFLELHITENHDPFFAAKRERNDRNGSRRSSDIAAGSSEKLKIYACFIPECEKLCSDWKKRRSHLVDKHGFPRNYDFFVVNTGIDGRASMLRRGVDAQGHRASSRERHMADAEGDDDEDVNENVLGVAKPAANFDPQSRELGHQGDPKGASASDDTLDGITSALKNSTLQSGVPTSISFGRRQMSGLGRR